MNITVTSMGSLTTSAGGNVVTFNPQKKLSPEEVLTQENEELKKQIQELEDKLKELKRIADE